MIRRPRLLALATLAALSASSVLSDPAVAHAVPMVAPAATGVIIGTVVLAGTQVPLPYSVVSIASAGIERFTDGSGRFTLVDVPAGKLVVRAKHIGYSPVDYPVTLRADDTLRIRIELTKVAVQLPAVKTIGACTKPGAPRKNVDPSLYVLFDQLRQNAERSRLLTRSYPFEYASSRMRTRESSYDPNAKLDTEFIDTVRIVSKRDWRYSPGKMVILAHDGRGLEPVLVVPELADFADDAFIANHCFGYGGIETIDGEPMVRFDFAPADKIKQPDISGIVYLDSTTLQIQRAEITLTKPTPELQRSFKTVTLTSRYSEFAPGIPIMSAFSSVMMLSDLERQIGWGRAMTTQDVIGVVWLNGKP